MSKFICGSFTCQYTLVQEKRKTLSLTVMPDMSIILKCPKEASNEQIEKFLGKKHLWIQKQLNFFRKFQKKAPKKEYISGESFLYLGRQYQLIVKKSDENRVVLQSGKLIFFTTNSVGNGIYTKVFVDLWYRKRAREIFRERYEEVAKKFGYEHKPRLRISKMQKRWGSYTCGGNIVLNSLLVYASKECIDYVITHELCHVKHKNHDKRFYKLLESKCPNWEKIKGKLEIRIMG